jgi:hypothetical protein
VRALPALAAAVALLAALVLRPLAHGVPWPTIASFWATVLGMGVVPGVLLCHGAGLAPRRDAWLLLGQGTTLGLALHGLAFLAGRAASAAWLPVAVALGAALLGLALGRRASGGGGAGPRGVDAGPGAPAALLTLTAALLACLLQPLVSVERLGEPVPADLLFHAGNAAELRHRHPLQDPRAAGLALNYHLLAYALPAEAADRAAAPVADPLLALAPLLWVALLALQLSNAGRAMFGSAAAGGLAAVVALLNADPGPLLGLARGAFANHFPTAVFGSPTTVVGLVLLAGLALPLGRWLEAGERRALLVAAVLAAAASGAKASVLPPVLAGLGLCAAWDGLHRRRAEAGRAALAALVLLAAGFPLTWSVALGESSYRTILRWGPGALFAQAPFTAAARALLGTTEGGSLGAWTPAVFAAWLLGHLGLVAAGLVAWLVLRRDPLSVTQRWALATAAVGFALALAMDAHGTSQLFFAYDGHVLLALFAGHGAALSGSRRPGARAVAVALAACALLAAGRAARLLPAAVRADVASARSHPGPAASDYLQGLAWLRRHASRDAVVFADNPSLLLSAVGEVRLYYETGLYTARGWEKRWAGELDPFPERMALQARLLRRPDAAALAEARRAAGPGPRLLVVADAVQSRIDSGFVRAAPGAVPPWHFFPEDLFERSFLNGAMQVYEARPAPAGAPAAAR